MSHDWNICPVCRAHYFEPEGHSCDIVKGRTLSELRDSLPPERRKKIEARTEELVSDLLERLRKVEHGPTRLPGLTTNWYRNPDGPEAADEIERLQRACTFDKDGLMERLRGLQGAADKYDGSNDLFRMAADEIERLRERCSPSQTVLIGDRGHYVSVPVHAEITRLRDEIERLRADLLTADGQNMELSARLATAERLLRDVQREMSDFDGRWGTLDEIDTFLPGRETDDV